jgi:hypothetical protein
LFRHILFFYNATSVLICVNFTSQAHSKVILLAPLTFTLKVVPDTAALATHPVVVPEVLITSLSLCMLNVPDLLIATPRSIADQ